MDTGDLHISTQTRRDQQVHTQSATRPTWVVSTSPCSIRRRTRWRRKNSDRVTTARIRSILIQSYPLYIWPLITANAA